MTDEEIDQQSLAAARARSAAHAEERTIIDALDWAIRPTDAETCALTDEWCADGKPPIDRWIARTGLPLLAAWRVLKAVPSSPRRARPVFADGGVNPVYVQGTPEYDERKRAEQEAKTKIWPIWQK